jgi:hypothetical protein
MAVFPSKFLGIYRDWAEYYAYQDFLEQKFKENLSLIQTLISSGESKFTEI